MVIRGDSGIGLGESVCKGVGQLTVTLSYANNKRNTEEAV